MWRNCRKARRVLVALFPIFATWTWCNLGFAGAWQIALGFALLGEAASLYYTLVRRNPLLAGAWFALAMGNRTELLLIAPIYLYYFWLSHPSEKRGARAPAKRDPRRIGMILRNFSPSQLCFCSAPRSTTGSASAGSPILATRALWGCCKSHGIQHGVFSLHAIRWNAYEMLFRGMIDLPDFPYLQPAAFGCSIFLASPFLFLLFREGGRHKATSWIAIGILTLFLWCHGNAGGWQFSYRYGMVLLPWMFLLIVENGGRKIATAEAALFVISVAISGLATYEFLWTNMIHP